VVLGHLVVVVGAWELRIVLLDLHCSLEVQVVEEQH